MSDNHTRGRFPVNRKARSRVLKPSPSPSPLSNRRYTPVAVHRRAWKQHNKTLERCKSEPCLLKTGAVDFDQDDRREVTPSLEILFRPQTCSDIFLSPDYHISESPHTFQLQGYQKEAKVVVNVTVEGSPGPVRTMVKLGSSVDETIRLVMDKYSEEGRTPRLDRNVDSSFQLYQSYFSLQSLSKTDAIGDVGSRSFYLRKSNSSGSNASNQERGTEIVLVKANSHPLVVLHGFFARKISKIIRRTCRLWKILGCLQCSG